MLAGNLREVYLEYAEHAAELATQEAMNDPIIAQIPDGSRSNWYVVSTVTGHENIASGFLVGRRFGVFDPLLRETIVRRGRKIDRARRLLPGYLLVFVWDVVNQRHKICSCPGVLRILKDADGKWAVVPDWMVDDLRRYELARSGAAVEVAAIAYRDEILAARPSLTRKQRRYRKSPITDGLPEQPKKMIVTESPYSALHGIEGLDDEGRISRFNEAIGVGS